MNQGQNSSRVQMKRSPEVLLNSPRHLLADAFAGEPNIVLNVELDAAYSADLDRPDSLEQCRPDASFAS